VGCMLWEVAIPSFSPVKASDSGSVNAGAGRLYGDSDRRFLHGELEFSIPTQLTPPSLLGERE